MGYARAVPFPFCCDPLFCSFPFLLSLPDSPNNLASGSRDNTTQTWDVSTGKVVTSVRIPHNLVRVFVCICVRVYIRVCMCVLCMCVVYVYVCAIIL